MSAPRTPRDLDPFEDDAIARAIARGLFASWNELPAQAPERFERTVVAIRAGMNAERLGIRADLELVREATA